jgi:dihydrofolate reductase
MSDVTDAAPRIGLIWAEAHGGVIGADGGMPWHVPEDLAHFKRTTGGAPVVMGRRTWESLPERFRPLPGRINVVLTSDPTWSVEGAQPAASVEEVLAEHDSLWVIGGGAVYAAFLPYADRLVVTDVDVVVEGDTWAPEIGDGWRRASRTPEVGWSFSSSSGLRYAVSEYVRGSSGVAG